jgi:hypothetical protein
LGSIGGLETVRSSKIPGWWPNTSKGINGNFDVLSAGIFVGKGH